MNISWLQDDEEAFIVIGSDGLVGSSIELEIQGLARAKTSEYKEHLSIKLEGYNDIERETLGLLKYLSLKGISSCTIFCAYGKGGFHIEKKTAIAQYNQFNNLMLHLGSVNDINVRVVLISSLGAVVSNEKSVYKKLTLMKESKLKEVNFPALSIRLPSLWGIKLKAQEPKGLIGCILDSLYNRKDFTIYGSLETTRNYLYIKTAAEEIMKILSNHKSFGQVNSLYNLRSRYYYCNGSILSIVKQVIPSSTLVYTLKNSELLDRENHTDLPQDGVDWVVDNCLNFEIKRGWSHLACKAYL